MSRQIKKIKKQIGLLENILLVCNAMLDFIEPFVDAYQEKERLNTQIRILEVKQRSLGLTYYEKRRLDLLKQKILL